MSKSTNNLTTARITDKTSIYITIVTHNPKPSEPVSKIDILGIFNIDAIKYTCYINHLTKDNFINTEIGYATKSNHRKYVFDATTLLEDFIDRLEESIKNKYEDNYTLDGYKKILSKLGLTDVITEERWFITRLLDYIF